VGVALVLAVAGAIAACTLNPQPLPPEDRDNEGASYGDASPVSPWDATAGVADGGGSGLQDAGTEPNDGDGGDAGDGGDGGDGGDASDAG